jgi:hypothetical protein
LAFFTFRPGFAMELSFKAEKPHATVAETAAGMCNSELSKCISPARGLEAGFRLQGA